MSDQRISITRKPITLSSQTPQFERVGGFLNPPLEISRARLGGLNMVDETIIVRKALRPRKGEKRWRYLSARTTR